MYNLCQISSSFGDFISFDLCKKVLVVSTCQLHLNVCFNGYIGLLNSIPKNLPNVMTKLESLLNYPVNSMVVWI